MTTWRGLEATVVAVVLVGLLLAGAGIGPGAGTSAHPTRVGDGTATVVVDDHPEERFAITRGRFGTGGYYLRIPELTVRVADVEGAPRIVYRVKVPELGVDTLTKRLVGPATTGRRTIRVPDRGLDPRLVNRSEFAVTVTVRVQSFEQNVKVYTETGTVPVEP